MLTLKSLLSSWPLIGHSHPVLASDWLSIVQFAQQLAGAPVHRHNTPGLCSLVTQDLMEVSDLVCLVSVTWHHVSVTWHDTRHVTSVTEAVLCSVAVTRARVCLILLKYWQSWQCAHYKTNYFRLLLLTDKESSEFTTDLEFGIGEQGIGLRFCNWDLKTKFLFPYICKHRQIISSLFFVPGLIFWWDQLLGFSPRSVYPAYWIT